MLMAQAETSTELLVSGMTCNNCARHVAEAIRSIPEVAGASVRLDLGRATVRWQDKPNLAGVLRAVAEAGYEAQPATEEALYRKQTSRWSPLVGWRFNVVVGVLCTLPLLIGEWAFGWGMQPWFQWFAFALALPVQIFCGAKFYVGAWRQLKAGASNMDTLVALGSTTAFGYSFWALLTGAPGHLYFMEAAAIITIISVGHWFEARTSTRAESALQALLQLAPQLARRRNADGSQTEVPVRELQVNDAVALKPGDHVPVDGEALEGGGAVDESMLTGESLPVEKKPGDKLYAGTVNLDGGIILRVTATGEETALAHIIAAVARAQSSRAEIQRLGDRVSSVFVPIVVMIAVATGLWWGLGGEHARQTSEWLSKFLWAPALPATALAAAFIQAAAVLIIACPCAMGLATPVAIMASANAAARRGILIRDGVALERAGQITAIVFDKTGTLTEGKPEVAGQESFSEDAMQLAAALARHSNHPLSQAVARLYDTDFSMDDFREVRGSGIAARIQSRASEPDRSADSLCAQTVMTAEACGQAVRAPEHHPEAGRNSSILRLGSLWWLKECGVNLGAGKEFETAWSAEGASLLGIAADDKLLGLLALKDTLKSGAKNVVKQLRADGLKVCLITGDNALTSQAIARQAEIPAENVFAEARPEQKAELISQMRKLGARVAFVGDGINDAPALEAADLGIAVSRASDVARAAADIILLKSEIQAVPEALGLARASLRTIKQNLFWAFFYNALGIPLAALGFLNPLLCALAMGLSDLVVIGNALRLMRWRQPECITPVQSSSRPEEALT